MTTTPASAAAPSSLTPRILEAIRHYGTLGIFLVLVMGEGEIRGELPPERYSEENLLSLAMIRRDGELRMAG